MIPFDFEFMLMYIFYILMIAYLLFGLMKSKRRCFFVTNSLIYTLYFGLMIYIFSDFENFRYGNSLVILFYGYLFIIIHAIVVLIINSNHVYKKLED